MRKKLAIILISVLAACNIMACGNDVIIDVVTNEGTSVASTTENVVAQTTDDTEKEADAAQTVEENADEADGNEAAD